MNKKFLRISILTISILGLMIFWKPVTSFADDGGQVGHEAVIEFYREDEKKDPPTTTSESKTNLNVSEGPQKSKPIGRFPQTGEIVRKSLMLSGIVLALSALYVYVKKQRKENEGETKP
ncbi:hypothetical protein ATZ33_06205 [Enterococcus silesiacus]|uniref:Gram-positive cocci surface proteins LPxTG domain-containing protein n=1 Tax=Enterococcus silesiacus TaxID=332949 RepID=A0A0S3K9Q8_9ENTE|nr:LPXTG cell wall anchor domain-containing protein [Enterococcus silesiacus]ALS00974.1 hypothetical protein ATZ33_06205 [Enterococcus silesiacus]OJG89974.1 hypothetical protein RV15_GL001540 [Enterococcus silesiacus]